MTAISTLRRICEARRAEAIRRGKDPGNAWAIQVVEKQIQDAKERVRAALRYAEPPAPPSPDPRANLPLGEFRLGVCREPCPEYRRNGVVEFCVRDLHETGCEAVARQRWVARAMGTRPPCERQSRPQLTTPATPVGLISPAQQRCIQIEITNFCGGHKHAARCSNCSRFCPHIREPFFMDSATFRRAVDSMDGYEGMLGIMGGEPTLHPQFDELVEYYRRRWAGYTEQTYGRQPIREFAAYHAAHWSSMAGQRCGLWTAMGPGYRRHYELIQDVFGYQCVNTHENGARHQVILATRRELGIGDAEWEVLRNHCWVQREWSAAITPRGAWFCEIAAALAMLYGDLDDCPGPRDGWPIEPGWWRRQPSEFADQLRWCEVCVMPLAMPARLATEHVQDVSPWHLERLKAVRSPAVAAGRYAVVPIPAPQAAKPVVRGPNWYMPLEDEPRRAEGRDAELRPQRIDGIVVSVDTGDELAETLPQNAQYFDRLVVVTAERDRRSRDVAERYGAEVVLADPHHGEAVFNKGHLLNAGLDALRPADWVLLHDVDVFLPQGMTELRDLVLNPGCLYYTRRHHLPRHVSQPDWSLVTEYELLDPHGNNNPWGYFQLIHLGAAALRARRAAHGWRIFPECFCSAGTIDHWTQAQWPPAKRVSIADWAGDHRFDVLHLWHGPLSSRWNGYGRLDGRWRYAGQTNLGQSEEYWARQWPVPCRVRRTHAITCEQEEIVWHGGELPQWRSPRDPAAVYEYSVRSL